MSLKDIRSECSDVASLLQPHVDGELEDDERERVAEHLSACTPCRTAVQEQLWVRATLRAVEPAVAPQSLRARVLLGLDEVDRETAVAITPEPSGWTRAWSRMRDVMRGGFVMIPAGAVAMALFWVARSGVTPGDAPLAHGVGLGAAAMLSGLDQESGKASEPRPADADVLDALAEVEPRVGFPVQVARTNPSNSVQLVSARVDPTLGTAAPNADRPGAQLRYKMVWQGHPTHVVDHQLPAGTRVIEGTPVTFGGRQYLLSRAEDGSPVLWFERSGVAHMLTHDATGADLRPVTRPGAEPDYSLLLHFAEHSFSQ